MIPLDKQQARSEGLKRRSLLSETEREEYSRKIQEHVIDRIRKDDVIGCYVSMRDEVSTESIIQHCLKEGIRICVPVTKGDTLEFIAIRPETIWKKSRFGVMEPVSGEVIPPEEITWMIVPLSSFDEKGNRTGYGKGFYDRILGKCSHASGIAFHVQKMPEIEADPWDVRLTEIITEQ